MQHYVCMNTIKEPYEQLVLDAPLPNASDDWGHRSPAASLHWWQHIACAIHVPDNGTYKQQLSRETFLALHTVTSQWSTRVATKTSFVVLLFILWPGNFVMTFNISVHHNWIYCAQKLQVMEAVSAATFYNPLPSSSAYAPVINVDPMQLHIFATSHPDTCLYVTGTLTCTGCASAVYPRRLRKIQGTHASNKLTTHKPSCYKYTYNYYDNISTKSCIKKCIVNKSVMNTNATYVILAFSLSQHNKQKKKDVIERCSCSVAPELFSCTTLSHNQYLKQTFVILESLPRQFAESLSQRYHVAHQTKGHTQGHQKQHRTSLFAFTAVHFYAAVW